MSSPRPRTTIAIRWALICALVIVAGWMIILRDLRAERQALHERTLVAVRGLADSDAEQIEKTVGQIDFLSTILVYLKENDALPAVLDGEHLHDAVDSQIYPAHVDARGVIRSARFANDLGMAIGFPAIIDEHRKSNSRGLRIHPRTRGAGRLAGEEVVRFTRRVDRPDGTFDGVILITVVHRFLRPSRAAHHDATSDFGALWLQDGALLTSRAEGMGDELHHYRSPPRFDGPRGSRLEPAERFHESEAYYVGWRKLSRYPLVAVAVRSEAHAMGVFERIQESALLNGLVGTAFVLIVGSVAALVQILYAERRRRVKALHGTFRQAVEAGRDAFLLILPTYDSQGQATGFRIEDCSERTGELLGRERTALLGATLGAVLGQDEYAPLERMLMAAVRDGSAEGDHVLRGATPRVIRCRAVRSSAGIALAMHDRTEQSERESQLEALTRTDPLTSLPNRLGLQQCLLETFAAADAVARRVALVYVDISSFRRVNDVLGGEAGDSALVAIAATLRESMHHGDHVARVGGAKFAVVLASLGHAAEVDDAIERLRKRILATKHAAFTSGLIDTIPIGVAIYPDDASDATALASAAELAMYESRTSDRMLPVHFAQPIGDRLRARYRIEQELRQALRNDELVLHYQPRVAAQSGTLSSFEALVRWNHPERGMVPPGEFIPIAEESGLIVELGDWVNEHACRQLAAWRDAGLAVRPLALNMSARQISTPGCRERLFASMVAHGIRPDQIAVELTESTMIGNDPTTRTELRSLRTLGVELHIDDFGTGYSSLSQLQQLDVDVIKIDRSFVVNLETDPAARTLCEAVARMCRTMGMTVVAEGVETAQQFALLRDMGCDEIQGYVVSRPVPHQAVPEMLRHPEMFALVVAQAAEPAANGPAKTTPGPRAVAACAATLPIAG